MGAFRWRFLLLGAAAFLLGDCSGSSSSHSLLYFRMYMSHPFHGLPRYAEVGHVDGQPIERYDSDTGRLVPLTPWMNQSLNEQYWDEQSIYAHLNIWAVQESMDRWLRYSNQSMSCSSTEFKCKDGSCIPHDYICNGYDECGDNSDENSTLCTIQGNHNCTITQFKCRNGRCMHRAYICDGNDDCEDNSDEDATPCTIQDVHIFQCIYGCECNGSCQDTRLFHRDAIDGRDVEQLGDERDLGDHSRIFLDRDCGGWLQRHLSRMKRATQRIERPAVKVARKVSPDGTDTLICHAHGFHPKGDCATWRKDGKVWEQETLPGKVLPNSDGTYYIWLSVRIHPRDRRSYRCHVEHVGLTEPLDVAWEGTEPPLAWVTREAVSESRETLTCQVDGFFPKEIKATWRKDGEVWEQETTSGDVVSHVNGTYHTWISIVIDPKDRGLYRCHVEHAGLQAPLVVAWEEPASMGPIVGGILGAVAALLLVTGIIIYVRNNQESGNSSKSKLEDTHPRGQEEVCIPLQEERETTASG